MGNLKNYLPDQYDNTDLKEINHNYLIEQFSDYREIFGKIEQVVRKGDYTLGRAVDEFEKKFAEVTGAQFAIGVGSGTDALFLSLKALGIGKGDEVITTPYTFYATIGAIVTAGATPVFVDIGEDYNIDTKKIEAAIGPQTKAILPVHWSGKICEMPRIDELAKQHGLHVIGDACHAILAKYNNYYAGSLGTVACFSLHPLKNLNVWGDGGLVVTNNQEVANRLKLIRNHGLADRDTCREFAYNSRLDTIQAVVGMHILDNKLEYITEQRINNSLFLDEGLRGITQIRVPIREPNIKQVFHIYMILCEQRDKLLDYLQSNSIDAKVHYPVPMHLQPAANNLGYQKGDFPVAEKTAEMALSLPVHEHISKEDLSKMIDAIKGFYR